MNKTPIQIELTQEERDELQRRARSKTAENRVVQRAKIILGLAEGQKLMTLGKELKVSRKIIRQWGQRFQKDRLKGLIDKPRPGRPARFSPRNGNTSGQAGLRSP